MERTEQVLGGSWPWDRPDGPGSGVSAPVLFLVLPSQ